MGQEEVVGVDVACGQNRWEVLELIWFVDRTGGRFWS
jgi:hypothetical protein